ncbi:secreted RxLR effector protein 161-like [Cryptomeria japonica]|uniref:secreted RxLR effector protein 161-like n=1 Tax=Cryptomeria japonica TaxID=3369 RepID=UPI0027DA336B|nr:secreted RxLR effector protein 161-like [Cryptomeria japonica]
MKYEMKSLEKNGTWDLVLLPKGRKLVGYKWVFKKKYGPDGSTDKYKGTKLSINDSPKSLDEVEDVKWVPYASVVGSLMYSMVSTRPDIAQVVGVLSQFMANPGKLHWDDVKRVLKYFKGTTQYALCYQGNSTRSSRSISIRGYVDADWAGDIDRRRSTSGYVFTVNGGAISWISKRQSVTALSTTEAEYMASTHACQEVVWLKRLCSDVGSDVGKITILCESQSAICLAKNPTYHA